VQTRPPGVTAIAILLWLAGAAHVAGALQDFGFIPAIGGGGAGFFVSDPVDGLLQVGAAIVTLFIAGGLWGMQPWARQAVVAIADVNLLIVFFTKFEGGESWLNAAPGIILNAAILLYGRSPEIRRALDR
jgi:hypothetical protein